MVKTVLYVEDDDNDALFMEMAFKKAGVPHPLLRVADGCQAIEYLAGQGHFADRPKYPLPLSAAFGSKATDQIRL